MPVKNAWLRPKSARAPVSTALLRPDRYICVGMGLQIIRGLLAYKERVGDAISVKTLVPAVASLLDLLHRLCVLKALIESQHMACIVCLYM